MTADAGIQDAGARDAGNPVSDAGATDARVPLDPQNPCTWNPNSPAYIKSNYVTARTTVVAPGITDQELVWCTIVACKPMARITHMYANVVFPAEETQNPQVVGDPTGTDLANDGGYAIINPRFLSMDGSVLTSSPALTSPNALKPDSLIHIGARDIIMSNPVLFSQTGETFSFRILANIAANRDLVSEQRFTSECYLSAQVADGGGTGGNQSAGIIPVMVIRPTDAGTLVDAGLSDAG